MRSGQPPVGTAAVTRAGSRAGLKGLRTVGWLVLAGYLLLLVKVVLLKDHTPADFLHGLLQSGGGWRPHNFHPFSSIGEILSSGVERSRAVTNVVGNVVLFVPLGVLLPALLDRRRGVLVTLAVGTATSLLFEAGQWFGRVGVADVDDVILNVGGVALGRVVYLLARRCLPGRRRAALIGGLMIAVAVFLFTLMVAGRM